MLDRLFLGSSAVDTDPNFEYVTLLLPGNGSNGAQNNTFLDASTNNFTITRNGDTTQGSFSPYGDLWSNYFDGTGDYLSVPDNAALDLSGDFTIECWVMWVKRSGSAYPRVVTKGDYQLAASVWLIALDESNGNISFSYGNPSVSIGMGTLTAGVWAHIAVSRSGTTLRTFMNGSLTSTATVSQDFSSTYTVRVGAGTDARANEIFAGYISNLRIVKGTAVYTTNFTPPTAPLTAITNTSLLTCQSNRFLDASTNNFAITRNGDVRVTNFAPFNPTNAYSPAVNGGSGYFDGTGDYLEIAATNNLNLSSGDWTVECWWYPSVDANQNVITINYAAGSDGYAHARINADSTSKKFYALSSATGSSWLNATLIGAWVVGQWYHLAYVRNGSTFTLYVNGVSAGSYTYSSNLFAANGVSAIGRTGSNVGAFFYVNGYVANARVVKGTAVYTGNFTPPTAPVTAVTNTQLLCNFTNAGIVDASAKNDLVTVGNAQISTAQSKFGGSSMAFDGSGDWLFSQTSDLFAFGTGDFTIEFWVYLNSVTGNQILYDNRPAQGVYPTIYTNGASLRYYTNSADRITGSNLSTGTWYHVALARSGTSTKLFVNGTQSGSTYTDSNSYLTAPLRIGADYQPSSYLNGYIDDLRITKGVARYTANFTPPAAPFPVQ